MVKPVYTVEAAKTIIKNAVQILDMTFPGEGLKVGVYQGERPFIDPWFLRVTSDDSTYRLKHPIEVRLDIRTMLDHVLVDGGTTTSHEYSVGIFDRILMMMAVEQPDPEAFMTAARERLAASMPQSLGDVGTDTGEPAASSLILPDGVGGVS